MNDLIDDLGRLQVTDDTVVVLFDQPAPLMSMNHRAHWTAKNRLTRLWRHAAGWAAASTIHGNGPISASWIQVHLPVPTRAHRDPANYAPRTKAIVDGLVDAHLWPDDTPAWVTTLEPVLDRELHTPSRRLVRVVITPRNRP